ncbi:MAG: response regulator [Limnohabitans sp.]|nr:MAG: response regulator [Limnohabitans sp.]
MQGLRSVVRDWQRRLLGQSGLQTWLLKLYLLASVLDSFVFYALPTGRYDHSVNLWHALAVLLLWPLSKRPKWVPFVVHAVTALSWLLLVYVIAHTGGVNSTSLIWFSLLALAVLMLQGPRAMGVWVLLILLTIFGMNEATHLGWVSPVARVGPVGVAWTLMNYLLVTVSLTLAIFLYDHMHRVRMQELGRRNDELKAMHRTLLQTQTHKDEFVAAVGHELRTPMNAILGFNGVLRTELADQPEHLEVVELIRGSTTHLLYLINDILDFSQIQAGKLTLHPTDYALSGLAAEVVHKFQPRLRHKDLQLQVTVDPDLPKVIHADRQRLLQVLHKLVDNAIKFTAKGKVELRMLRQGSAGLRIEVEDTGLGIAQDRLAHIFKRLEYADVQINRAYGGTGLGLALCERLTHLMGGTIGVSSQPGHGTLFWIELPLQEGLTLPDDDAPPLDMLKDEALRILVVDDNAINLQVARLQLQKIWPKAEIVTVGSGAEALQRLDTEAFDIALVDMIMPELDGMQLARQIRHQFPAMAARMPILALTANTNPVEREQCLAAGMNDVLHKPMDVDAVRNTISRQIRKARA